MPVKLDVENGEATATQTVYPSGNSVVVGIPPAMLDVVPFEVGDEVELTVEFESGEIVVRDGDDSESVDAQPEN